MQDPKTVKDLINFLQVLPPDAELEIAIRFFGEETRYEPLSLDNLFYDEKNKVLTIG